MRPGVTPTNLLTFYYAAFMGLSLITLMGAIQPFVLTSFLHLPQEIQGSVIGKLGVVQEVVIIAVVGLVGLISDKLGPRYVFSAGFLVLAISYALHPTATQLRDLLYCRAFFAVSIAILSVMFSTVIADYVMNEHRGKAFGLLGIVNTIAVMVATSILFAIPRKLDQWSLAQDFTAGLRSTFYVIAGLAFISALILIAGLKSRVADVSIREIGFTQLISKSLQSVKDPYTALACAAAFASRGNLVLAVQFVPLWVNKHGMNVAQLSVSEANRQAQIALIIITTAASFIASPLVGILADRMDRVRLLSFAAALSALGYCSLFVITDPLGSGMKILLIVAGVGEISMALASQVLIAQQSPAGARGSVIGVFGLFGALGIALAFGAGGYLFDHLESAPFLLFGMLSGVVAVVGLMTNGLAKRKHS